ncbi:MAG TPA: helix-turn-helix transcriptional regulator [Clostridia bacterium]|nr:helix-turn-helix transcriptional regulator [Clostridia bacterium]
MRIGERLRRLREEKSMTQQQLADILGKSRAAVGKYETGARMPDNNTLHAICDYFNVTTDYILGRSEYRKTEPVDLEKLLSSDTPLSWRSRPLEQGKKAEILAYLGQQISRGGE